MQIDLAGRSLSPYRIYKYLFQELLQVLQGAEIQMHNNAMDHLAVAGRVMGGLLDVL